ncbi:MAG: alpha/beta hydrolase, partial [Bacteroidota bacterium]
DYTRIFHEFFLRMGLEKMALYGSATGAQLAIRYALDYPEVVTHIFLDNAAHFEDEFRKELLMHYFPDLKPQKEGTHLNVLWDMVSAMFQYFPWCFKSPEYRLYRPQLPSEALHGIAMDFLKAGKHYYYAYRAAFLHEHAAHVQQLQPRTTIFRWEGSIILKHIDALLSFEFPDHIQSVSIPEATTERMEEMAGYMGEKASGFPAFTLPEGVVIAHDETDKPSFLVEKRSEVPPDITKDGVHLLQAWAFIQAQHPELSPEEIQRELLLWYGAIK